MTNPSHNGIHTTVAQLHGDGVAGFQRPGGTHGAAPGIPQQRVPPPQRGRGILARKGRVKALQPEKTGVQQGRHSSPQPRLQRRQRGLAGKRLPLKGPVKPGFQPFQPEGVRVKAPPHGGMETAFRHVRLTLQTFQTPTGLQQLQTPGRAVQPQG